MIGGLPGNLFTIPGLQVMSLSFNRLTGPLPLEVTQGSNLGVLRLSNNGFGGTILPGIDSLRQLKQLDLGFNNFESSLPIELNLLQQLEWLSLEGNSRLTGRIPTEFASFSNLGYLSLSST